jgi:hypothetical protein
MKKLFTTLALVVFASSASLAQDISGDWHGTLKVNGGELRLVLHITKNADGTLKARLDKITTPQLHSPSSPARSSPSTAKKTCKFPLTRICPRFAKHLRPAATRIMKWTNCPA